MTEMSGDTKLEIKKVLVIDDDEVARNLIANHLQRMGIPEIVLKEDGESGWQAIAQDKFDFIVLDWKLPKLSGLAFFNRIRRHKHYKMTPILVVSGFLEKNDFRLLQEFPATGLMEKPFTVVLFQNRVEELLREAVWYGQNVALIDTIIQAVKDDGKKAEQLLRQVLKTAPNPIPLAVLAARRMIKAGMTKGAQVILEGVLKIDDQCIIAMNELGKAYHLQGDHKRGLETLKMANRLSPQNVQRLCLLGEVELNLQEPEAARAYFERALEIDVTAKKAESGLIIADNMESMLAGDDPMQVPKSFASLLNTMGIALVRNGQFAKGVEQYRAAMAFVREREDSARVAFNLGLGYLRWGKPNEALPWFKTSERMAPAGFGKSANYVRSLLTNGGGAEIEEEALGGRGPATADAGGPTIIDDQTPDASDGGGGQVIPFPVPTQPADGGSAISNATEDAIEEDEGEGEGGSAQVVL